jgi:hypothetical protein
MTEQDLDDPDVSAALQKVGGFMGRPRNNPSDLVIPTEARDLHFAAGCRSLASLGMTHETHADNHQTYIDPPRFPPDS